ncbi:phosphotransferase family protein [Paenibacillus taiwanensis]|uniref:phosphotransferase family protein n=1 Tax=Paenibacillus taiwanensis TaxID=401638 RepID=UPI0003FB063D|nr:aminoglycoside phosphotransferase family protein [Paenibacillus taiwanensis]
MNPTSRIYEELTSEQITKIMTETFDLHTKVSSCSLLSGGLFNTTYLIQTIRPEAAVVLRVAPIHHELLLDFEKTMMGAETHIYNLLATKGVPVPKVIICDESCKVIPRVYMVMEYIPSVPMNDPTVPEHVKVALRRSLGQYTSRIHELTGEKFGWPTSRQGVRGSESWSQVILQFVDELAAKSVVHGVFEQQEMDVLLDLFQSNERIFDEITTPVLVHNDLWGPNVLVAERNNVWEIAAIIDADRSMYADPEYEFVLWDNNADFMEGYGKPLDMSIAAQTRRESYKLLLAVMNAYVFKIEYNNSLAYIDAREDVLCRLEAWSSSQK